MIFLIISSDPLDPILVSLALRSRPKLSLSSAVLCSHSSSTQETKAIQDLLSELDVDTISTDQPTFAGSLCTLQEVQIDYE